MPRGSSATGCATRSGSPFRPGTSELWVGDVGYNTWEEVKRMTNLPSTAVNFGWPCHEGAGRQSSYDAPNLSICESLYTAGTATGPYYAYQHGVSVVDGDGCPLNSGSVISAISFYAGGAYPSPYNGALFFGDHSRNCIWAMLPGANGLPSANNLTAFVVDPNSHRSTSRPIPSAATSSTPTSTAARSAASSTSAPTTRPPPWPPPTRQAARRR
jgi:glucose/arabinose dehydrogenase